MKTSLNIILDCLSKYNIDNRIKDPAEHHFECAELLPGDAVLLDSDHLYICTLSAALNRVKKSSSEQPVFLCLRDRIADTLENDDSMSRMIVINENIPFSELFNLVQNRFFEISSWYSSLQDSLIKNKGLQDIIDLSENVLKNYIQITNSTFKLLAYTKNTDCDDPITIRAREAGGHTEETLRLFQKYRRYEAWDKNPGITVNNNCEFSKYPLISGIFKFRETYFTHAVMTCNNYPPTEGMIELFEIFLKAIGIYVENDWNSKNSWHRVYDSFLSELLDGSLTRRDVVIDRANHVMLPVEGTFTLTLVSSDEGGRRSPGWTAQKISEILPSVKTIVYRGSVVILSIHSAEGFHRQIKELQEKLSDLLEQYNMRAGISAVYHDIMDSARALDQARLAMNYSGHTPGASLLPDLGEISGTLQHRVIFFEDSFTYILLGSDKKNYEVWKNSAYYEMLKELHDYDETHNMNNLQLLYVYLAVMNRPTQTAKLLHMSRNNVVYRISRIEEMLNIDLEIPHVRDKLFISYKMLKLYGLD